ncbi:MULTISPECIES: hypothetical protein [unclassified Exiguobacterium]|uniref:hypothetical protein n=1 Tax=unclassified Exiguobacterium TaxID=2644629 RepID=UPI001040023E|nr:MULTISPECIES: hypothetical protein [unclassified Exiguobacterium]TCI26267.1 hypothetical protein EVJ32_06280 [Exiguobacterium sp. SH5S4]TCI54254.1 hypothetical protein EVJ30_06040 [Exiguobacterium sp. SH5S13]TCI64190.1 hypothetical protein EVJ26_04865 [Exiguobacterium sp. SH3S1]
MNFLFYIMIIAVNAIVADTIIKTRKVRIEELRLKVEQEKLAIQRLELEMKRDQDKLDEHGF